MSKKQTIIFLALLTGACEPKEDDSKTKTSGPTEAFLSIADLTKPTTVTELDTFDFDTAIEEESTTFQATHASEAPVPEESEPSESDLCFLNTLDAIKVKADGSLLTFAGITDLAKCLQQDSGFEGITLKVNEFKTTFFMQFSCPSKDYSELNGKSFPDDLGSIVECEGTGTMLINIRTNYDITLTYEDTSINSVSTTTQATGTTDNQPCNVTGSDKTYGLANSCQDLLISTAVNEEGTRTDYMKFVYNNVSWQKSDLDTWYSSGSIDATLNNWLGRVQFTAADAAPTYSFSNGTETKTGTLGLKLTLREGVRKALKKPWMQTKMQSLKLHSIARSK